MVPVSVAEEAVNTGASLHPESSIVEVESRSARLGFAVKVVGRNGMRSHDARRWQNSPHLRVSLGYLREILNYLAESGIQMYRMASGLAPYVTHPDHPEFHSQVAECLEELEQLGSLVRQNGVRLSFHPGQYIVINSPDEGIAERSIADIEAQAQILDAMGLGDEAVIVTHIGGAYGNPQEALARFAWRTERLTVGALRRLVIENDDRLFSIEDALLLHKLTGLRVVFDAHHHRCYNPHRIAVTDAARMAIQTWEGRGARAKIHYSSPRDGLDLTSNPDGRSPGRAMRAHADYIDPEPFIDFYRSITDLSPDVMLEAKAKDKALLRLRKDLVGQAPELGKILAPESASLAIKVRDS
jgi:UV DNA damage endonuclease